MLYLIFRGEGRECESLYETLLVVEVHHLQHVVPVDGQEPVLVVTEVVHSKDRNIFRLTDCLPSPQQSGHQPCRIHPEIPASRLLLLAVYVRLPGDVVDALLLHDQSDHLRVVGGLSMVEGRQWRLGGVELHQVSSPAVSLQSEISELIMIGHLHSTYLANTGILRSHVTTIRDVSQYTGQIECTQRQVNRQST